jgi:hypothetical protein
MQVAFRNLLATGLVALVGSCTLNHNGLVGAGGGAGAGFQGAGGVGGTTGTAGTAGMTPLPSGSAGTSTPTGSAGAGPDAAAVDSAVTGAAGDNPSGAAGDNGAAGDTGAGGGAGDTTGAAGDNGAAGDDNGSAGAGGSMITSMIDPVGCSDGTREGFVALTTYPTIAACAGGWEEPGLLSTASQTPQCDRSAGNEGNNPDGGGCSVADLCSVGWHVCETAKEVATATAGMGCAPAYELYLAKPAFFLTRQRAEGLVCDPTNQNGDNNVYGCGNIGSAADKSCAPFMHMLRDSDCANHAPWACADNGHPGNTQDEYDIVTKSGAAAGGVLCCKD